jgi:pimeloyl-ACP methyl ester carboxylesterase
MKRRFARPVIAEVTMNSSQRISRRQLLAVGAIVPLGLVSKVAAAPASEKQATFVLVHGAWHGGWCWKKLTPLLQAAGHQVVTPTLTGLGERSHLLAPEVDLDTHIQDITAVLEYEDLRDVVLVGHSYGGMVIAGVASKVGARLAHLVYLDAFLPENGKAVKDYVPLPPTRDDGWRMPPLGPPSAFDVTDERDVAWVAPRLGDQPLKTFTQPVQLSADENSSMSQTFIQCTQAPFFAEAAARARRRGFQYRELFSAGHDAMITRPTELAKILLGLE